MPIFSSVEFNNLRSLYSKLGSYATTIPYIKRANYINSRKKIVAYFYMLSLEPGVSWKLFGISIGSKEGILLVFKKVRSIALVL